MQTAEIYANGRTYAEHCAWLDSLSPDERSVLSMPRGYAYEVIAVATIKRWLASEQDASQRLWLLENLDRLMTNRADRKNIIELIEPTSDVAAEIVREALHNLKAKEALDLLASYEVFSIIVEACPSMLAAIKHMLGNPVSSAT